MRLSVVRHKIDNYAHDTKVRIYAGIEFADSWLIINS